jgi:prepilin-type N-terminal cleavage/methylation domain-containing protein
MYMMRVNTKGDTGFTLVEIAIVLLIVTILLGYTVALLPVQQELRQYRAANDEMEKILDSLYAFAQVNRRLPCPDTGVATPGDENSLGAPPDDCVVFFGYLPAKTLGLNGKYNETGRLIDPWGGEYRYAISDFDGGDGNIDLVTANGIRDEGMINVVSDLFICNSSPNTASDTACTSALERVVGSIPAVIISMGKDNDIVALSASSNIQTENIDDFHDGTNDKVYISTSRQDDYDDIVKWISPNILFSKMIDAGLLP